jgi:hypothetical protein
MFNEHIVATVAVIMVFLVPIVLLIQIGATWRARLIAAREEAYQKLAQEAADAQQRTGAELAALRQKLDELERFLREV